MTRDAVYFEKVFHWTRNFSFLKAQNFFYWNVSYKLIKTVLSEFNIKIHCEINFKLVFHERLWKKNFTVYPSLYLLACLFLLIILETFDADVNLKQINNLNK